MEKISFVIPCYGSENTIEYVVSEIRETVAQRPEFTFEIIAVNDCSPDKVYEKLLVLAADDHRVKVINFAKNMNRPGAVMAGLNNVSGKYVVVMDDDGQCPMERFWDLFKPIEEGHDVSIAKYPERKQSAFKNFGTFVNKKMTEFIINRPKDMEFTNFMIMRSYIVDEIIKYKNPYPFFTGLILRTTKDIINVNMEERERISGSSTFTFGKMLGMWVNGLTAFSIKPLRISSLVGVICAVIGFVFGIVTIIRKLVSTNISVGWSSTISIMLFIGGLIMLMLGMIGEYLGRIYISLNNSPQFVIKEKINFDGEDDEE
ncbi:MAG: glycosyltransferase [Ruminococcus sp.]|nr:glycosyltransferase [Ruminococcus sp.]